MFKKELLEKFLDSYNRSEIFPFTRYEDALINNFDALDVPFSLYHESATGWLNSMKIEISENLLSLPADEKLFYLEYLKNKLTYETAEFDDKELINLIRKHDVKANTLDFNKNKGLKKLLLTSFKSISGEENLIKFKDLHREYYDYLFNIERNILLNYINSLIEDRGKNALPPNESYKNEDWFKFGVLFASGEMEKFYSIKKNIATELKPGYTASMVAKELGDEGYLKYVSGTINGYGIEKGNGYKNIFNWRDKMLKIISHCEEHEISVIPYFTSRLPPE